MSYDSRDIWRIQVIIQLCRAYLQREELLRKIDRLERREKQQMTPKMRGALESLKKLKSFADDEADKLTKRIESEAIPALNAGFKTGHGVVDQMHTVVDEVVDFANQLMNHNGGDPLDVSDTPSHPRSSEVAGK